MMLTQDQIKELCKLELEGFNLLLSPENIYYIEVPDGKELCFDHLELPEYLEWRYVYYPLFLTRGIEVIDKKRAGAITYNGTSFRCWSIYAIKAKTFFIKDYSSIDEAKEQALIYYLNNCKT